MHRPGAKKLGPAPYSGTGPGTGDQDALRRVPTKCTSVVAARAAGASARARSAHARAVAAGAEQLVLGTGQVARAFAAAVIGGGTARGAARAAHAHAHAAGARRRGLAAHGGQRR